MEEIGAAMDKVRSRGQCDDQWREHGLGGKLACHAVTTV